MTTSSQVVQPAAHPVAAIDPAQLVREIALDQLSESGKNPRRTMNQADLDELAASIREVGITVPLLVRPGLLKKQEYEIVCGHRRFAAAVIARLKSVPCIVRELGDAAAAEIALIDNLQRVDVPPMEEAEAFGELLDRLHSIAAVAAKVGKEQGYVAKRLKLRTLTECSRQALAEQLITIDHALLLARLAAEEQDEALKWCLDTSAGSKTPVDQVIAKRVAIRKDPKESRWDREWEPESVQSLRLHIEQDAGTLLARAPWPLDMALLTAQPACSECPRNTKANAPLFGDLEIGEPTCTDGACFKEKTQAWVKIQARVSEGTQAPLRVSWKSTSTPPRQEKAGGGIALNQTFKYGQWLDIGKKGAKCEHMCPAVTVDWSDANARGYMGGSEKLRKPGEIIQVCIQPKCKVHVKSYEKAQSNGAGGAARESYEEREAREKKEVAAFKPAEAPVRRALYDAIAAKISSDEIKRRVLLDDDCNFHDGICFATGFVSDNYQQRTKHVNGLIAKAKGVELDQLLLHGILGRELEVDHFHITLPDKGRGDLRKLAKEIGLDSAKIEREAEKPEKPAPAKKAAAKPAAKKAAKKAGRK